MPDPNQPVPPELMEQLAREAEERRTRRSSAENELPTPIEEDLEAIVARYRESGYRGQA